MAAPVLTACKRSRARNHPVRRLSLLTALAADKNTHAATFAL